MSNLYHQGIHRTLRQIEWQLTKITNQNCLVGLFKIKVDILVKLMDVQKHISYEENLLSRIDDIKKTVELMKPQKRGENVNRK